MPTTPNGHPVIAPDDLAELTVVLDIGGAKFRVAKAHAASFRALLRFLNELEPFAGPGWDGGYAHRKIRGSTRWSEHAAGAAVDVNASQHPMGAARYAGWSEQEVRMIRWYLRTSKHGQRFRWGADFKTTPDPMHFEIKAAA